MAMTPELAIALLACARIGAPHTVVFGGFSSQALVDRITDSQAVCVITQDGSYRRGAEVKLKPAVDEALKQLPDREERHRVTGAPGTPQHMEPGRDHWWHELMAIASRRVPRRTARFRASALPAVHVRHDREAERHSAHHGRLSRYPLTSRPSGFSICGTRTFTAARPISAG